MNNIIFGQVIDLSYGAKIQFSLPLNAVLVWREGKAVLVSDLNHIPKEWSLNLDIPWKILGDFEVIQRIFPKFKIPIGSKVIGFCGAVILRIDLVNKNIQYFGRRLKRVLIVDDSATMRKLLKHVISSFEDWVVVQEVDCAEKISDALDAFYPDIITLDLHLGELDGVVAMRKFVAPRRFPALIITSQPKEDGGLVMDALDAGAVDYLQKPIAGEWDHVKDDLLCKLNAGLRSKWQNKLVSSISKPYQSGLSDNDLEKILVVIGSSTGGTQALQEIFTRLPEKIPPILVTQHIPPGFSKALADRLNMLCPFEIKEASQGDEVRPGRVLIAPGDHHLRLAKGGKTVDIVSSEPVNRFRPSVDFMFSSVAENAKQQIIAIMLTGMGKDGAHEMLNLRKKGAGTIAQDESTSVVFGMPKEAIRIGAAENIVPLQSISNFLMSYLHKILNRKAS